MLAYFSDVFDSLLAKYFTTEQVRKILQIQPIETLPIHKIRKISEFQSESPLGDDWGVMISSMAEKVQGPDTPNTLEDEELAPHQTGKLW